MAHACVVSTNRHGCKKAAAQIDATPLVETGVHTVIRGADRYPRFITLTLSKLCCNALRGALFWDWRTLLCTMQEQQNSAVQKLQIVTDF
jgi:hypothetical protein